MLFKDLPGWRIARREEVALVLQASKLIEPGRRLGIHLINVLVCDIVLDDDAAIAFDDFDDILDGCRGWKGGDLRVMALMRWIRHGEDVMKMTSAG